MAQTLVDFLTQIGRDPEARAVYTQDPRAAMSNAGLSESDISAALSKNPAVIHNAVIQSHPEAAVESTVVVVVL